MAKQNKPAIRFKGFTDAWEQRKLFEMCGTFEYGLNAAAKEFDGKNKYIRITDIDDASREFLLSDLSSPDICLDGMSKYLLSSGDIVFARTGASVGKTYIYRENDGIVYFAGFLIRAKVNQDNDAEFVFQSTLSPSYEKYIRITSQRSGQPGVNAQEYGEYDLFAPSKEEQQRIGHFLRGIDSLITLHQRKYDKLQVLKKAMLEKMFPKNGSSVPEIRFKGFTDAWEQRKLGEFFEKYQNTVYLQDEEEYRQISIRNTGVVEYRCTNKGKNIGRKRQYLIDTDTHPVTLTFTRQTVYEGGIGFVPKELNGAIVTENMPLLEMTNASQDFMKALFNTSGYYKSVINDDTLIGSAQKALHEKQWLDSYVCIPVLDEQKQIGSFFQQLEHLITLHQRKFYVSILV